MKSSVMKRKAQFKLRPVRSPRAKTLEQQIGEVLHYVKNMTPAQSRESLIRAGIITRTGRLTSPYR
jgi:hypothetical protein